MAQRQQATHEPATRADAESFAESLPDTYLLCREIGHSWRPFHASWMSDVNAFERTLRCSRCHTRRVQHISRTGHVLSGQYEYPEGYVHKGMGRITGDGRDALRLSSILRHITDGIAEVSKDGDRA